MYRGVGGKRVKNNCSETLCQPIRRSLNEILANIFVAATPFFVRHQIPATAQVLRARAIL